jgi:hypothetical protein
MPEPELRLRTRVRRIEPTPPSAPPKEEYADEMQAIRQQSFRYGIKSSVIGILLSISYPMLAPVMMPMALKVGYNASMEYVNQMNIQMENSWWRRDSDIPRPNPRKSKESAQDAFTAGALIMPMPKAAVSWVKKTCTDMMDRIPDIRF